MAIEKVREYFESFGAAARIREFDVSSATVELAAQALGCAPERIAKTLSFLVDGGCALVVAAGIFSWFLSMSTRYSLVYGSLVSLIILLVWLYLCGNILLLGAAVSRTWVIRRTR